MQQVQSLDSGDELVMSKIGSAVHAAISSKESLQNAIAEAIDSSTNFGYELGADDLKSKLIDAFKAENNENVAWALGVIESVIG